MCWSVNLPYWNPSSTVLSIHVDRQTVLSKSSLSRGVESEFSPWTKDPLFDSFDPLEYIKVSC